MSCCRAIPTPTVLFLVLWSYYVYVVLLCTYTIKNVWKQGIYLGVYHFLLLMFLWCYFRTMCADIEMVPEEYKLPERLCNKINATNNEKRRNKFLLQFCYVRNLDLVTRTVTGGIRFCKTCEHVKPDRAHHCSKCGTCILRMDHHCPWVNNCIGFSNYKYFVLFLSYTSLYCIFYAATTAEYLILFYKDPKYDKFQIILGFFGSFTLAIVLSSFTIYHFTLISRNSTTIEEAFEPTFRDHNEDLTFDIDFCENFEEIFGERCCLWFIPVWTTLGDGLNFPCRFIL